MKSNNSDMGFLDHLEELRWHLIRSVLAVFAFTITAYVFKDYIMSQIILTPKSPAFFTNHWLNVMSDHIPFFNMRINQKDFEVVNMEMSGQFLTALRMSVTVGFILACPYIIWEIWSFLKPALYENEQKYSSGVILVTSTLFILGILFGYYILSPISIDFFFNYTLQGVSNVIRLSSYMDILSSIVMACGLVFELPVIIYFLSKTGIVSSAFLIKYRKHAIVVTLILAAIITPPDVFSQVLISIPLVALYEVGIGIAKRIEKKRKNEELTY